MTQLTLLDVCRLPEAQIHSKYSFFKTMLTHEPVQVLNMKANIAKLSYTIKTIGVKDQEVGIITKRVPLKYKSPINRAPESIKQQIVTTQFVPHKSFYSASLIPIKKQNKVVIQQNPQMFGLNQQVTEEEYKVTAGFRNRGKSMCRIRTHRSKGQNINMVTQNTSKSIKNIRTYSSYSNMLLELGSTKNKAISTLSHEENPLFKKIKKITNLTNKNEQRQQKNITNFHIKRSTLSLKKL